MMFISFYVTRAPILIKSDIFNKFSVQFLSDHKCQHKLLASNPKDLSKTQMLK